MPPTIIAIGNLASDNTLLRDIVDRLRALGHDILPFADARALHDAHTALAKADVVLVAPNCACPKAVLPAALRLRGIVSAVTGIEGIDTAAATGHGIIVANGQIAENTESMAEATILLMLASLYDLHQTESLLLRNLPRPSQMTARMVRGKTIGFVGFGQIARAMASRLDAWGVSLQAASRRPPAEPPDNVRFTDLDTLMATSDVVCVLASLNDESRGLLDKRRLELLKTNAVLVNTGRGAIIDEEALSQVAKARPDLRLALDTFTIEPLPPASPLRDIPHAILTPHMVGHTQEAVAAMPGMAVGNITRILQGQLPHTICNPAVVGTWLARWEKSDLTRADH